MVVIGIGSLLNEMQLQGGLDSENDQTLTADYADSMDAAKCQMLRRMGGALDGIVRFLPIREIRVIRG
jgi:hypothetical protein